MARSDVIIAASHIPGCKIYGEVVYSLIIDLVLKNACRNMYEIIKNDL
jgi:hypothetical protein|tara:strand:+ start:76 stop:219 length:144 start_codon:yes stop_codon:yes gene_type:complete